MMRSDFFPSDEAAQASEVAGDRLCRGIDEAIELPDEPQIVRWLDDVARAVGSVVACLAMLPNPPWGTTPADLQRLAAEAGDGFSWSRHSLKSGPVDQDPRDGLRRSHGACSTSRARADWSRSSSSHSADPGILLGPAIGLERPCPPPAGLALDRNRRAG